MLFSAVKRIKFPPLRTALTDVNETLMACKPTAVSIVITRFLWLDNPVKTEVYLVHMFTVSLQQSLAKPGFEPVYHLTQNNLHTYTHTQHRCLDNQISIPYPSRSNLRLNSVFVTLLALISAVHTRD